MNFVWDITDERTYKSLCRMADNEEKTKAWDKIDPTFAEARNLIDHLRSNLHKVDRERRAFLMALQALEEKHGRRPNATMEVPP